MRARRGLFVTQMNLEFAEKYDTVWVGFYKKHKVLGNAWKVAIIFWYIDICILDNHICNSCNPSLWIQTHENL